MKRPDHEIAYLMQAVAPVLSRVRQDPKETPAFLAYAMQEIPELNSQVLSLRLYRAVHGERSPSAFLTALLLKWEQAQGPAAKPRRPRQANSALSAKPRVHEGIAAAATEQSAADVLAPQSARSEQSPDPLRSSAEDRDRQTPSGEASDRVLRALP